MSKLTEIQQQQELERRDARISELERLIMDVAFDAYDSQVYLTLETDQDWWDKRCKLISD